MDCYVLNSKLEAETLFEDYFSFIWTEKYSAPSDFKIEMPASYANRSLMKVDAILMISDSDQPMVIETVMLKKQDDGSKRWIVQGRDLTTWMELRQSKYDVTYTGQRVSQIAANLIAAGATNPPDANDKIPNMSMTNVATDGATFDYETTNDNLLTDVQNILNDNNCAVRCDRIGSQSAGWSFRYRIYNGTAKNVIFSDRDDTLINTQAIVSKKKFRNRAEIRYKASNKEDAKTLVRIVYGNGGSASQSGLNRRTIRVDATSVNPNDYPGSRLNTVLDRMARAALGDHKSINAIDGEIPSYTTAKYGSDYKLGDIVKFKSDSNVVSNARVTEYIWIVDESGERQYPTIQPTDDQSV